MSKLERHTIYTGNEGEEAPVSASNPIAVEQQGGIVVDSITIEDVATEAKQDTQITALGTINTTLGTPAQEHTGAASPASARLTDGSSFYKATTPDDTQPISAASLPLPSGASTSDNQSTIITAVELLADTVHSLNSALDKAFAIAGQLDDTGTTAATENNVAPVRISAARGLHVTPRNDAGTEIFNATTPGIVQGPAATAATVSGNPVYIGAIVQNNSPTTSYAVGRMAPLTADSYGRLIARLFSRANSTPIVTTITSSTSETTIASASSTGFRDMIYMLITNTSASTTTTITIKDATSGTTRISTSLPGSSFMYLYFGATELRQNASNNNWTLTCGTSTASIVVSLYQELINDT